MPASYTPAQYNQKLHDTFTAMKTPVLDSTGRMSVSFYSGDSTVMLYQVCDFLSNPNVPPHEKARLLSTLQADFQDYNNTPDNLKMTRPNIFSWGHMLAHHERSNDMAGRPQPAIQSKKIHGMDMQVDVRVDINRRNFDYLKWLMSNQQKVLTPGMHLNREQLANIAAQVPQIQAVPIQQFDFQRAQQQAHQIRQKKLAEAKENQRKAEEVAKKAAEAKAQQEAEEYDEDEDEDEEYEKDSAFDTAAEKAAAIAGAAFTLAGKAIAVAGAAASAAAKKVRENSERRARERAERELEREQALQEAFENQERNVEPYRNLASRGRLTFNDARKWFDQIDDYTDPETRDYFYDDFVEQLEKVANNDLGTLNIDQLYDRLENLNEILNHTYGSDLSHYASHAGKRYNTRVYALVNACGEQIANRILNDANHVASNKGQGYSIEAIDVAEQQIDTDLGNLRKADEFGVSKEVRNKLSSFRTNLKNTRNKLLVAPYINAADAQIAIFKESLQPKSMFAGMMGTQQPNLKNMVNVLHDLEEHKEDVADSEIRKDMGERINGLSDCIKDYVKNTYANTQTLNQPSTDHNKIKQAIGGIKELEIDDLVKDSLDKMMDAAIRKEVHEIINNNRVDGLQKDEVIENLKNDPNYQINDKVSDKVSKVIIEARGDLHKKIIDEIEQRLPQRYDAQNLDEVIDNVNAWKDRIYKDTTTTSFGTESAKGANQNHKKLTTTLTNLEDLRTERTQRIELDQEIKAVTHQVNEMKVISQGNRWFTTAVDLKQVSQAFNALNEKKSQATHKRVKEDVDNLCKDLQKLVKQYVGYKYTNNIASETDYKKIKTCITELENSGLQDLLADDLKKLKIKACELEVNSYKQAVTWTWEDIDNHFQKMLSEDTAYHVNGKTQEDVARHINKNRAGVHEEMLSSIKSGFPKRYDDPSLKSKLADVKKLQNRIKNLKDIPGYQTRIKALKTFEDDANKLIEEKAENKEVAEFVQGNEANKINNYENILKQSATFKSAQENLHNFQVRTAIAKKNDIEYKANTNDKNVIRHQRQEARKLANALDKISGKPSQEKEVIKKSDVEVVIAKCAEKEIKVQVDAIEHKYRTHTTVQHVRNYLDPKNEEEELISNIDNIKELYTLLKELEKENDLKKHTEYDAFSFHD